MHTLKIKTILSLLLLVLPLAAAETPPSDNPKFTHVLARAKLQAPVSDSSVKDLTGFAAWYFFLNNGFMQFVMKGRGKRSELRQMWLNGNEAAWKTSSGHVMTAKIALPVPNSALTEFTIMQIYCENSEGKGPALRISWRDTYRKDGTDYSDVIIATIRTGLGDNDHDKKVLAQRVTSTTAYRVGIYGGRMTIEIGGLRKLYRYRLSYWDGAFCNFKAGVYVNHASSDSVNAITQFSELRWY